MGPKKISICPAASHTRTAQRTHLVLHFLGNGSHVSDILLKPSRCTSHTANTLGRLVRIHWVHSRNRVLARGHKDYTRVRTMVRKDPKVHSHRDRIHNRTYCCFGQRLLYRKTPSSYFFLFKTHLGFTDSETEKLKVLTWNLDSEFLFRDFQCCFGLTRELQIKIPTDRSLATYLLK